MFCPCFIVTAGLRQKLLLALGLAFGVCVVVRGAVASGSTGTIEGRIFNPATGENIELARVHVEGTALEAFTDATGHYRLTNVPAGEARVRVSHTRIRSQSATVAVVAGQTTQHDMNVTVFGETARDSTVKLDRFVVASSKEMDNAALAINTQRVAANQVNVISADEFGGAAESKVGEVLKSLPGISMGLGGGGEPFLVSLDGVPADNVPVTVGGFDLATSSQGTGRSTGLHQSAINTISRIEIVHTPTPESSGSALAGSVNMVPLNAFERVKPRYTVSTFVSLRDEVKTLDRTPGPLQRPTHKIRPGFEFTGIVPVNSRFGFTVSASASTLYRVQDMSQMGWRGAGSPTNGNAFPDTTPELPYLSDYTFRDGGAMVTAASFGTTLDFKLGPNDTLSFAFQWAFSDFALTQRVMNFFVNRVAPGNFGPTFTRGSAGAGEIRMNNTVNGLGGNLFMPTLTYRHNGPVWQWDAGLGHSQARRWRKDATTGNFFNSVARRQNVTVSFDEIFYLRPNRITVTDGATGAPVDPFDIDSYTLNTAAMNAFLTKDVHRTAYASLRRPFHGRIPVTLKAGIDLREQIRDNRSHNPTRTFVGPDGLPDTADDAARQILDVDYAQKTAPFGFPAVEWTSNFRLFDIWEANPGYFTENATTTYTNGVAQSNRSEELISAAYLRGDLKFLGGRLKLVGGLRAEQTNVKAQGRLVDPTLNFRRDASGRVILGPNGAPQTITSNALEAAQLTNIDRGLKAEKEYLRWFPSINATYNFTENFVGRAGYYWSVGRPNFSQYAGGVSLPNTENPPAPNNVITVNNAGIKAWSAETVKVALEYYFEPVGLVSVSAFSRSFENMFGSTITDATPAFLALYGLSPAIYGEYDVSTQYNLPGTVRTTGVSLNYKQALTFLPNWGRGVRVFANVSAQRVTGDVSGSFSGYTPRVANWGISLSRPRYTLRVNWNYTGKKRQGPVALGRGIEPGTYNWGSKRLVVDVNAEYTVWRNISLFASLNNILNEPVDNKIYGPSTPEYARFRQRQNYGALWTFGVKGVW